MNFLINPITIKTNLFATLMCLTKGALIVTLVFFVGGCSGPGSLQPISSGTSGSEKVSSTKLPPFVKATGVGKDKEEALKSAFREAVGIAVGVVVDSETVIRNDKVIKDEIIDYSRGFVESYDVLPGEGKNSDGLYEVTIRATVKDRQLYEKLRRFQPASAKVEGSNIFGAVTSRMESRKKAAELLAKSLAATDLPLPILKTEFLSKKPRILEENAESILAEWAVRVSFDQKLYQEKVYPWLKELLSDVATRSKMNQTYQYTAYGKIWDRPFSDFSRKGFWLDPFSADAKNQLNTRRYDFLDFMAHSRMFARDNIPVFLWSAWGRERLYDYIPPPAPRWSATFVLGKQSMATHHYDVFWLPSEAADALTRANATARRRVSGVALDFLDISGNIIMKRKRSFSKIQPGKLSRSDFLHLTRSPALFYTSSGPRGNCAIIPVFQFDLNGKQHGGGGGGLDPYMSNNIIIKWHERIPLETMRKIADINCRVY